MAPGDFLQDRKHPLRHTGHEAGRLVVVVSKKSLPAATTGRDEARYVVRDRRLGSFQGYGFKRHRRSCLTGDRLRHTPACLRDVSVNDRWPRRPARAQGQQGRRSCSQTCLHKPLFRPGVLPTRGQPLLEASGGMPCAGVSTRGAPVARAYAPVPKSAPTPAVSPIASAPQKVTRTAPTVTRAPPTRAATPPRSARQARDVPETTGIRCASGARAVTRSGSAAPPAKLQADAHAACSGRALSVSVMPSSSRAWAPNAS